jgi:hypothetical protein
LDAVSALPPGASRTWSGIWAEHIVVSDNVFSRGPFGTGPQNKESDERIRDMIVERNLFTEVGSGIESQVVSGMTIRNNIFNGDPDSSSLVTVVYQNNYGTPAPSSTYIYNNTFYMPTSNAPLRFSAVTITAANGNVTFPTGTVLRNNLAYAPQATSDSQGQQPSGARGTVLAALGVPAGDYDSANNTSNINVKGDNPTFNSTPNPPVTDPAGITAGSWKPTSTANISGLGAAVPVWEDFFSNPQTAVRSLGAVILP